MLTPNELLERANWFIRSQYDRVYLQQELTKVFELSWNDDALRNKPDWVQEIRDPQPFNSMQWLVDVLAHDDPQIKIEIPRGSLPTPIDPLMQDPMQQMMMESGMEAEAGGDKEAELADVYEKAAQEIFAANDRRLPTTLQRDELYAAMVQGMIVNKIADMRLNGGKWNKYKQKHRGASPFYIKSIAPSNIYFEYDEYGVCEVLHRYLRPMKEVVRLYGDRVGGLGSVKANPELKGMVLFAEYWTEETRAAWVEQIFTEGYEIDAERYYTDQQMGACYFLMNPQENQLGFIPYSVKVARGTGIFNRQQMVYPHLYSGWKSKLFLRNNLFFTVAASLAFMLVNPQFAHETDTPENPIQLDFSAPAVQGIRKGDKVSQIPISITPEFKDVMTLFAQKIEESTVSKVVAGQSPGGVTAASGINLLIGGGKLTVSSVQKALGEVRESTIEKIFNYVRGYPDFADRDEKAELDLYAGGMLRTLDPSTMPEYMDIKVNYEPFLPQDKAMAVQTWLTPLLQEKISDEYFWEQVGVQDSVTMRRQIDAGKDRKVADQLYQQNVLTPQAPTLQGQAAPPTGMEGQQADEGFVEEPSANPLAPNANPANELNAINNAIENPMQTAQ